MAVVDERDNVVRDRSPQILRKIDIPQRAC
jgi:hypothetical protein